MFLLLTVFIAIVFIVVSSAVFKLHPLIALLLAALGVGMAAGLPIDQLAHFGSPLPKSPTGLLAAQMSEL